MDKEDNFINDKENIIDEENINDDILLKLESDKNDIKIIVRNCENNSVAVKNIQTAPLFAYYWINKLPEIETFLESFEKILKITIKQVYDHDKLKLSYKLIANDELKDSNLIEIIFNEVSADDKELKIIGDVISFESSKDDRGLIKRITSFRRKVDENIIRIV